MTSPFVILVGNALIVIQISGANLVTESESLCSSTPTISGFHHRCGYMTRPRDKSPYQTDRYHSINFIYAQLDIIIIA